jgi:hypothetical protein
VDAVCEKWAAREVSKNGALLTQLVGKRFASYRSYASKPSVNQM